MYMWNLRMLILYTREKYSGYQRLKGIRDKERGTIGQRESNYSHTGKMISDVPIQAGCL